MKLTQEEKRIKLAEAAGWKGISKTYLVGYAPWRPAAYAEMIKKTRVTDFISIPLDPLPDYFNDLNAVHVLEMTLTAMQWTVYVTALCSLTRDRNGEGLTHAPAAQRAEALGLTLKLWTE